MNLILFGPPGIGKSTVIGVLKSLGTRAIDLEDVYPNRVRFQLPNMLDDVVFGGADLNPARRYAHTKRVLLIAEQDAYDRRRANRDARQPEKKGQAQHAVEAWNRNDWDLVIDTSKLSARDVAFRLRTFLRKEAKK